MVNRNYVYRRYSTTYDKLGLESLSEKHVCDRGCAG